MTPDSRFLAFVLATALALRLAFVLFYPQVPPTIGDDRMYDQVAWNLATGKGFSGGFAGQTERPGRPAPLNVPGSPEVGIGPVYPAFLAAIYAAVGHEVWAVRVAQALLGCLTVLLMHRLAAAAFGGTVARVSAVTVAVYPALIIYTGPLLTEALTLTLLPLLLVLMHEATRRESARWWAIAGAVAGVTVLLREEILLALPVLIGAAVWLAPTRVRTRQIAVFVLVTTVTVGTWTVRNYVTFKQFVLVSAHGGDTLWLSAKGWSEWRYDDPELKALTAGLNYLEQNDMFRREGLRLIVNDPIGYLKVCVDRLPDFWVSSHTSHLIGFSESFGMLRARAEYGPLFVKLLLLALNCTVLAIALLGAAGALRSRQLSWPVALLLIPIVVIGAVHFFLFAAPRYQLPILPFVIVFASAGLMQLRAWTVERRVWSSGVSDYSRPMGESGVGRH